MMNARRLSIAASISALALVTACSSSPRRDDGYSQIPGTSNTYPSSTYSQYAQFGVVERIEAMPAAAHSPGAGAVVGAVLGGVVGNQIGSGQGRAAATAAGAIGGALIGNSVENRNRPDDAIYRVSVRFDNGSVAYYDYRQIDDLRPGDRVKLEGGQLYRV